jgi:soluble lytic murein transglycosylase-like protein
VSLSPDTFDRLNRVIWPALERSWGLPAGTLEAIAWYETRGTFRDQTSRTGARGIFQLRPIALAQVRQEFGIAADPSNPYQASAAAAALMSRYLRLFRGSLPLALAAYNAGEGTVRRFLTQTAQGGAGQLPRETRDYVVNVVPRIYD